MKPPLLALATVAIASGVASADEPSPAPRNNVTASLIDYGASAAFTRTVSGWLGVGVSATYLTPGIEDYALAGAGLHLGYRSTTPRNPQFFAELSVRAFRVFDIEPPGDVGAFGGAGELHTTALVVGAWVGWRWFWENGLNVGIGAGLDYPFASWGKCAGVCCSQSSGSIPARWLTWASRSSAAFSEGLARRA